MEKKDIRSYTFEQLQREMESIGEKAFRGRQIYEWLHVKLAESFDEMTNLSKSLRQKLSERYGDTKGIHAGTSGFPRGSYGEIPVWALRRGMWWRAS